MKIIEFIGLPASGKSFVLKKIKLKLNKINSNHLTYIEFLFTKDNLKNFFFIRSIYNLKKLYFYNSLNENFLKNFLKTLIINITIKLTLLSLNKKKYLLFYKSYKKLLDYSSHSPHRKKRMEIYFLFKLLSLNIYNQKQSKNFFFIIDDEGFLQSLVVKYDDFKNQKKNIFREINNFISLSPLPNKIILIDNKNMDVIKRSKQRKIGYTYYLDDKKNKLANWRETESYIIKIIKKRKINLIKFKNKKNYNIRVDKLVNFIKK
tara:strand:- start:188 stop:973 length:786 start_codon:yes stop_codon:yes gene_type:complete